MPIRNPFARRPSVVGSQDENTRPNTASEDVAHPGFERVDTVGSKASSALSISSRRSQDTGEYKMSGEFVPSRGLRIASPLQLHSKHGITSRDQVFANAFPWGTSGQRQRCLSTGMRRTSCVLASLGTLTILSSDSRRRPRRTQHGHGDICRGTRRTRGAAWGTSSTSPSRASRSTRTADPLYV
jgi:hypothetical protein